MRNLSILISASTVLFASMAEAQTAANRVVRNNIPYFVRAGASHAVTSEFYNWHLMSPPDYSNGISVTPGTRSYRIIPSHADSRLEPRLVDGFTHLQRLSAATPNGTWGADYEPKTEMMGCVPQAGGGGALDPDPSNVQISIPMMPAPAPGHTYRVTRSFPVIPVNPAYLGGIDDMALALTWVGGEEQDKVGAHSYLASWMDGPTPWQTTGFIDPQGGITYVTDPQFILWFGYTTAQASLAVTSDYGQRRITPITNPNLEGHSLGSYYSDGGSQATMMGLSVRSDASNAGLFALPLFNVAAQPFQAPIPFLNLTLEVNPGDPFLTAFSTYIQTLDSNGNVEGIKFPIPATPGLIGVYLGFEMVIVDPILVTLPDSTQAVWVQVR